MTNDPKTQPKEGAMLPISDSPHAPFIFYDGAPTAGFVNGIVSITLTAGRAWIGADGQPVADQVVVAFLRGNIQAAMSLRQAIDKVLALAARTP